MKNARIPEIRMKSMNEETSCKRFTSMILLNSILQLYFYGNSRERTHQNCTAELAAKSAFHAAYDAFMREHVAPHFAKSSQESRRVTFTARRDLSVRASHGPNLVPCLYKDLKKRTVSSSSAKEESPRRNRQSTHIGHARLPF